MMMNKMKQTAQKGFTLIELMIVVAIIGILAAIAIPAYQDYIVKSQVGGAYREVSSVKTAFEVAINEGKTPSLTATDPGYVGFTQNSATYCTMGVTGITQIECTTKGGNAGKFNGHKIALNRDGEGVWTCAASGFDAKFNPKGC
jgi:type IV pilus assembly protein PilA